MDFVGAAIKLLEVAGKVSEGMGDVMSSRDLEDRLERIPSNLGPYGVDPFGFDPQYVKKVVGPAAWLYRKYFRCEAHGLENVPEGRCLIIANHSGQLPFDGLMIGMSMFLDSEPPRFTRSMVERFVPATPFVSPLLARCGQILGTPENCRRLLGAGESILVFPEGVRGLNKTWSQRYRLQRFRSGLYALGAGNQYTHRTRGGYRGRRAGADVLQCEVSGQDVWIPGLSITPTNPLFPGVGLLPLPTRYRIRFGKPMNFDGNANDEDDVILEKVSHVKNQMQQMIDEGLKEREHIFW